MNKPDQPAQVSGEAERIIRRFVPKLATEIRKAVEDRTAELGRPLTPAEVEECAANVGAQLVLRLFGSAGST